MKPTAFGPKGYVTRPSSSRTSCDTSRHVPTSGFVLIGDAPTNFQPNRRYYSFVNSKLASMSSLSRTRSCHPYSLPSQCGHWTTSIRTHQTVAHLLHHPHD